MSIRTIESGFDYQAKRILLEVLESEEINNLDNIDKFQDKIWDEQICSKIGRKFMERLSEWSGDEIYLEVMEELRELDG